jgi:7-carboxy-7-deazaguanine synthase
MFVKDIFYSFQGEGPWVGYPQLFLRFYGCNIHCDYCDEPDFVKDKKRYTIEEIVKELGSFSDKPIHSLSLTGGEPLMYADTIKTLASYLDMPLYLETNATLPKNLAKIKDDITYFSLDYKPGYEEPFTKSLDLLKDKENVFVKYILCKDFPNKDIETLSEIMKNRSVPFVIQPVTPFALVTEEASPEDIYRAYDLAKTIISDVRVIPQTHKFINLK